MNEKFIGKLRCFQAAILVFFIMHGGIFELGTNILFRIAEEDAWISAILSGILGFIPFYIFISISYSHPNHNIFEIIDITCGKVFGKIITILIILLTASFVFFNFWSLTNLISSQFLYKTPQVFIYIIFTIPIVYMLSKNVKVIFRSVILIFFITITLHVLSVMSLATQLKFINLLPILKDGFLPIFEAAFGLIGYTVLPLFFLTAVPNNYYEDRKNYKKYMIISYIISSITLIIVPLFTISIFGINLTELYQYPEFQILRRVSIGGFIERVESTLSIHWICELFILIIVGFYFINQGIQHFISIKSKGIKYGCNTLLLIIAIITSINFFRNNTIANDFSVTTYPFVCYGFLLLIFILYIIMKIRKKRLRS